MIENGETRFMFMLQYQKGQLPLKIHIPSRKLGPDVVCCKCHTAAPWKGVGYDKIEKTVWEFPKLACKDAVAESVKCEISVESLTE